MNKCDTRICNKTESNLMNEMRLFMETAVEFSSLIGQKVLMHVL